MLAVSGVAFALLGVGEWQGRLEPRPLVSRSAPDIVFLVMDTTRRDHLSLYGYPYETTPRLDALAVEARVYDDAWSVAPWTSPSHASMFTGLLPAEHDADGRDSVPLPEGLQTLPGLLREAGYRTAAFVANPNLHSAGWARDFDVYAAPWIRGKHTLVVLLNEYLRGSGNVWELDPTTGVIFKQAKRWWSDHDGEPRFLFINLLDPHAPYQAPEPDFKQFVGDRDCKRAAEIANGGVYEYADTTISHHDAMCIASLYDAEIHGMDRQMGEFFDWLAERSELDDTLLVITSDHGERLGEGGHVGHLLEMDQHLLRVPLIIRHLEMVAPERIRRRVQLTGLPGLVLSLVGAEMPELMEARSLDKYWDEHSVAQHRNYEWYLKRIRAADPDFDDTPYKGDWMAVVGRRFMSIWSTEQGPDSARLFDYRLDAALERDVAFQFPKEADRLREIGRKLPGFGEMPPQENNEELDPEIQRRLKALGYVK
jgi:arylsulfatase A-like enzyme